MAKKDTSIRAQLEPLIREFGLRELERKTGIPNSLLSEWLNETPATGKGASRRKPRRMADDKLDKIADALRVRIRIG